MPEEAESDSLLYGKVSKEVDVGRNVCDEELIDYPCSMS